MDGGHLVRSPPTDDLPLTVGGLLKRRAREHPDQDLLVCDEERLTFGEADRRSLTVAAGLVGAGAGRGTHVAVLMPNGADFVVTWLAAARIGAVSIPISTFSTPAELREVLHSSDADLLIMKDRYRSHDYLGAVRAAFPSLDLARPGPHFLIEAPCLRHVYVEGSAAALSTAQPFASLTADDLGMDAALVGAIEEEVTPSDRMAIVYTSGSTSSPKGVIHGHGAMIRNMMNLNQPRGLGPGSKLFSNSPMFWIGGLAYNLVGVLAAGATLICSNETDAGRTLDLLERERPELVNGYAQSAAHLAAHPSFPGRDLSSIRRGNLYPIMPDDVRPYDPELRHNLLGSTEAGSVCLMDPDENDLPESLRGSFGKPVTDLEARIVDPETGADLEDGLPGELWLRGPMLMEGYYGRERFETFTNDGWYRSGDMFVRDPLGYYFFKGRNGDMIKTGGANVSPREVEGAISELSGGVPSIVFGVPDADRGQIVVAAILSRDEVDVASLLEALRSRVSHYKIPRTIVRIDPRDVPLRSSGKPDLIRLAALVTGTGDPAAP